MRTLKALVGGALGVFLATAAWADSSSFLIKPYLFSVQGKRIGVAWEYQGEDATSHSSTIKIFRGDKLYKSGEAESDGDLFFSVLPMPPCGFGRDVSYQVEGLDAPVHITEVPCGSEDGVARFSFMADTQTHPDEAAKFVDTMKAFPSQAILHGGDITDQGDDYRLWVDYFANLEELSGKYVLFPTVGNHEYRKDPDVPNWKHFFRTEAADSHYSFDLGPAHIVALNSAFEDDPSQIKGQLEWLENELKVPARWKVIYFHHPAFSTAIYTNPLAPRKEYRYLQDYYVPLFEQYKVNLVLNGHTHIFETSYKDGVHYITVGPAGGKMGWYGGVENPYLLKTQQVRSIVNLEAAPDHLRAMSVAIDGSVLDDLILR